MGWDAKALREKRCEPCEGGVDPLDRETVERLRQSLHADWQVLDEGRRIERNIEFVGFNRVMSFANAVAWIANTEGHHPVIELRYGGARISWTTHAIDGLSVNDFICAAKTDQLLEAV
ncbi:MAG: 4a-hydroxytetrahydrobiopterin dehydratase [Pseudomonadota bacterium]